MAMDHGPTSMRDFFKFTADRLLASLSSMPGPYINHDKLPSGTFAISSFNPEDDEDLDSSDWLFHPMPQDRLSRFSLDRTGLPPDADSTGFQEYSENRNPATLAERMEQAPGQRAIMLEECFRIMYIDWERKLIGKSLIEKTEWEPVVYPNPFLSSLGLLDRFGPPGWSASVFENVPTIPHVMLLAIQDVEVTKNELLVGEVGPIVQAIRNRLDQKEFANFTFFPVLIISLSGPQHGRMTQGCFDRSGILQLRMSKLYSFETEKEAPFDLFLRFLANTPKIHPEEKDVVP